ncbi:uncharacterized protein LOC114542590 [Dendronephthya gigantea]|uniref:uncharacterized protein LOC114542590 n=1 Tax=Dendronephthya gigantea TaxID=151771 RepID=UPI00106BC086|nr:uncharacterized protein LOC114542590 [Dendronephthya gigantea]
MKNFWYLEERHELIYVTKYLVPRILLSSGSTARIPIFQESLQARIFARLLLYSLRVFSTMTPEAIYVEIIANFIWIGITKSTMASYLDTVFVQARKWKRQSLRI